MAILQNTTTPIMSLTVSGRPDEVWHPSIIDFLTEHGLSQWPKTGQGWRYWCSMTTDHPEDVYLFVSNDGQNWQPAPHHASQPNAPNATQPTNSDLYGHWADNWEDWITPDFADGEIIYDPVGDQIFMYCVDASAMEASNPRKTVSNTFLLSAAVHCNIWDGQGANAPVGMWAGMSPTVIREDATRYHFYSVAVLPGTIDYYDIAYAFSTDGQTASGPWQLCTHNGLLDQLRVAYPGLNPNHIKAKANPHMPGQIEIVVATRTYNTPSLTNIQNLVHIQSSFIDPSEWTAPLAPTPLLSASLPFSYWEGHEWDGTTSAKFDGYGIYRSEFVLQRSGNNLVMQLWYGGMNLPRFYGSDPLGNIGYTYGVIGTLPANLQLNTASARAPSRADAPTITRNGATFDLSDAVSAGVVDTIVMTQHGGTLAIDGSTVYSAAEPITVTLHGGILVIEDSAAFSAVEPITGTPHDILVIADAISNTITDSITLIPIIGVGGTGIRSPDGNPIIYRDIWGNPITFNRLQGV